jgi:histidinol-phosphatase (PHP family)
MIKTNWHTHTYRCGHAKGTDEEYVQAAIRAGVKTLGFSDHAAYTNPNPEERMDISQVEEYISSIRTLRDKYKDQINIYVGMECEYFKDEWDTLKEYRKKMDYIILGQHNLWLDGPDVYHPFNRDQVMQYVEAIETACRLGFCDCIAHPDVFMWGYPEIDDTAKEAARAIADISLTYNVPVELNCGSGVRYGMKEYTDGLRYAYPVRMFFEEFARKRCQIVIGLDIHDPVLFLTDEYLTRAISVCDGLTMNWQYDYDMIGAAQHRKNV